MAAASKHECALKYHMFTNPELLKMAFGLRWSLIVAVMLFSTTQALFKEQAGKYDWLKQNIGFVDIAKLDESRAFVATNDGVVGALNVKDGSILWRAVLDEKDSIRGLDVSGDVLLTVSSTSHVRAFGNLGQQLWELSLLEEQKCRGLPAVAVAQAGGKDVGLIACGETLRSVNISTGRRLWESILPAGEAQSVAIYVNPEGGKVSLAMIDASGLVTHIAVVDISSGDLSQHVFSSGSAMDNESLQALEGGAMALTADKSKVCALSFAPPKTVSCQTLKSLSLSTIGDIISLTGSSPNARVLRTSQGAAILRFGGDGVLTSIGSSAESGSSAVAAGCTGPTAVVAWATSKGLELFTHSATDGTMKKKNLSPGMLRTAVEGAILGVVAAFAGPDGDALVQLEEGSLAFFTSSSDHVEPLWVRDEALAAVSDLLFSELPAPSADIEAEWAAQQPSTSESLRMQLLALKVQVGIASPEEGADVERHDALTSDRLRPTRDPDGFRRQLILATRAGKIVSVHTGDGRVLWTLDFGTQASDMRLARWKTPHNVAEDALVVAFSLTSAGDCVTATVINAHSGKVMSREQVKVKDADILQLPHPVLDGSGEQHIFVVASVAGSSAAPVVLPATDAGHAAFAEQASALVRWKVSEDGTAVEGYSVTPTSGISRQIWRVAAAPEGSGLTILAAVSRDADEAVYSAARPVFGGGIIMKHLSPNTLLVVAGPPPNGFVDSRGSKLVAMVVDAASGRVLFSQTHSGATGPVHALVSEHWGAYHFWNTKLDRWQIAVLDAYRPAPPALSVWDLAVGRSSAVAGSDYAHGGEEGLFFERQVFNVKLPAATLAVTRTAHGTSVKMLLLGTPFGQVYTIDRRLIDPRRPHIASNTKPTPAQAAEGLPPYNPDLTIGGPAFATLDRRVARLRAITTAPAVLESASLLVATGLDVFYIRLQPSKGFDMVPDDFPFALLVAMVAGMTVALGVLRAVMQKRALKLKWQ